MENKKIIKLVETRNGIEIKLTDKEKKIINDAIEVLTDMEIIIIDPTDSIYINSKKSCEATDIVEANYTLKSLLGLL